MKLRRIIALILCITLLMLTLAGCGNDGNIECDFPDCGPDSPPHINFNAALATFPPDTVMIKSGELSITWAHLYVVLFNTVSTLFQSYGVEIPWEEEADGHILADIVLEYVTNEATTFLAYMYGIESSNLTLNEQELAEFKHDIDNYIEEMGGIDALEEHLRETGGVYNFEVFENILILEFSVGLLADNMFGEDASDFPDASVMEYISNSNLDLLMAMHILRMKTEDGDDAPLKEAEEILNRLRPQAGSANFIETFKAEMLQHSDDVGGLMSFPDGYLFLPEAMVREFSDTTAALSIGEMSGIVETDFGYHIILRLPVDYDVPVMTREGPTPGTFRQLAAANYFESTVLGWRDFVSQNIEFTSEYESIDLAGIFGLHLH